MKTSLSLTLACLTTTLFLSISGIVAAQEPAASEINVRLSREERREFGTALQALARQAHLAFVAEGWPLRATLSDAQVAAIPGQGPLSQMTTAVAAAYDYDVQRQNEVFRLTKRYSQPADLPGVTLAECVQMMGDIERMTEPLNPKIAPAEPGDIDPVVGALFASLTPEQRQAMAQKTADKALRVSSLTPAQQALAWRAGLYLYVQSPMSRAEPSTNLIRALATPPAQVDFNRGQIGGLSVFGYDIVHPDTNRTAFFGLSSPRGQISYDGTLAVTMTRRPPTGSDAARSPAQKEPSDPTDPLPQSISTVEKTLQTTLKAAIESVNASDGSRPPAMIDAALAAKPITVIGQSNAAPDGVLDAMAAIYGLRVKKEDSGKRRLTRPPVIFSGSVADLPDALRRVVPSPFLRALHQVSTDALAAQNRQFIAQSYADVSARQKLAARISAAQKAKRDTSALLKEWHQLEDTSRIANQRWQERWKAKMQQQAALSTLSNAAVQQLRADVEPQLKTAPNQRLPLSSVSDADQQAFAVALIAKYLEHVQPLLEQPAPEFLTHFEDVRLTGAMETNPEGVRFQGFFFSLPTLDGRVLGGAGFGFRLP